jgi:hypothetical protein
LEVHTTASQGRSLLSNRDWAAVEGQLCLVTEFVPMAAMDRGHVTAINATTPLASVGLRTKAGQEFTGYVAHKTDFAMLWAAFRDRSEVAGTTLEFGPCVKSPDDLHQCLAENEEVWLMWSRNDYKAGAGLMRPFLPRLTVMVSPKGALDLLQNRNSRPDLHGMARARASVPLLTWKPEIKK